MLIQNSSILQLLPRKSAIPSPTSPLMMAFRLIPNQVFVILLEYFSDLFKEKPYTYDHVIDKISPKFSPEDNSLLLAPFHEDEFKRASFHMHPDKFPGPNGFNPAFFPKFWDLCGKDIFSASFL